MAFHTEYLHKKTKNSYFSFFLLNWRLANLDYDINDDDKIIKMILPKYFNHVY